MESRVCFAFFFTGAFAMTIRPLCVAVLCLVLGCGPTTQTHRPAKQVGWVSLVHEYRDNPKNADAEYLDQTIQIYLPALAYRVEPTHISAYHGLDNTPGALLFECEEPLPSNNKAALLVTGRCLGCTRDGIERANKVVFFIRIADTHITVLASP
jgi:hypothetical protein